MANEDKISSHLHAAMPRILIAATHKSSGKTTVSIGLCAALRARGLVVQPFKKGPDYIDPLWLSLASGRDCQNLDSYLMPPEQILESFTNRAGNADIAVIEGNKGLYDGLDLDGSNSNAALAAFLHTPVVLVIDARGMTRGVAPLILGYQQFDPTIRIAGVILNQLGGSRHEAKLRAVIDHYTDVPVLGAIHHDEALRIVERHLGLVPSNETGTAGQKVAAMAEAITRQVDLDALLAVAASAPPLPRARPDTRPPSGPVIRIGIARDAAFAFYYPDDLDSLRAAGAELLTFDTLRDSRLPPVDALFIGGGFPEVHMRALQANISLRHNIRSAIEAGMPVYAECGGLMYLARRIIWGQDSAEMVGAIRADIIMHARPIGRGYVHLRETGFSPWPPSDISSRSDGMRAHEFHYSSVENLPVGTHFAYDVLRGHGIDGRHDGIVYKNVLASYAHLRDVGGSGWAARFVQFVRRQRDQPPGITLTN